ncbi:GNAT family N-acetyltransferase [Sporosarcina koreensis]|uniref:GNAT family N-acetyltransferase n=1 Tax=Sporosarcina koreensis TaxID=334735 RepID=UPI0030B84E8F
MAIDREETAKCSVVLRPIAEEDIPHVLNWAQDHRFCAANEWDIDRSEQEVRDWWRYCVHLSKPSFIRLGIVWNGKLIGYADLAGIEKETAELGIAIGDSSLWGKGKSQAVR